MRILSPELRRALSGTLPLTLLLFAISLFIALAIQIIIAVSDPGTGLIEHAGQGVLNTFATFAALELGALLIQAAQLKGLTYKQNNLLAQLLTRDKEITNHSNVANIVINAYRSQSDPTLEAVGRALLDTMENIRIDERHASVQGEQMAIASYRWFWSLVLQAQKAARSSGAERVSVFATHSAPITFWRHPDMVPILITQQEFVEAGGILNRVFIDRSQNNELLPVYADVISNMRAFRGEDSAEGPNIFFVKMEEKSTIMDFMLTYFRARHYSSEWNPRHIDSNNSDIASCEFYVGEDKFLNRYWYKWKSVVDLLRKDDGSLSSKLMSAGLDVSQASILAHRPQQRELDEMLNFPS